MFYASLGAEILRICCTATESNYFKSSCQTFISRMINQGAKSESIERCLGKIYGRKFDSSVKFAITYENLKTSFINKNTFRSIVHV